MFAASCSSIHAIEIVVDYTLDQRNENWFDPLSTDGQDRRAAVDSAAAFLSAIITNDDWEPLASLNESFTLSDIAAGTIYDLDGRPLTGSPESDGEGFSYSYSSNNIDTTNRSSVGANEYIVYVGAFAFDSGTTSNAKGGWDSNDRRNSAGRAGAEFNTWGGRIYFNTAKTWYAGQNPGLNPTDDYGVQDSNKSPSFDSGADNWDWSTSSDSWKGFDLRTIDSSALGMRDLYATAVHELMHALGATSSAIEDYVGVDSDGDFVGASVLATYGGPAPGSGGHFAENTQSTVWDSDGIISETVLDPNSLAGVRKYFTDLDAALLRDLGYTVLEGFAEGDFNTDGVVDAGDYLAWRGSFGQQVASPGGGADANGDGVVNAADFTIWRDAYVRSAPGGASSAAPEPNAAVVLFSAALASFAFLRDERMGPG